MIYWIFSILTALIAFILGNIDPLTVSSNYVFKVQLKKYGTGSTWFSRFRRQYGIKGLLKVVGVEIMMDIFPILIGGMLFGIKGQAEIGRALGAFVLILCRCFPVVGNFTGKDGMIPLMIGLPFMYTSVGVIAIVLMVVLFFGLRYKTFAVIVGGLAAIAGAFALIDNLILMRLCVYAGAAVIIRSLPALRTLMRDGEERVEFKEDLTYKLDEKF